jgi:putative inorganic carbon (hco3(-)) transporter
MSKANSQKSKKASAKAKEPIRITYYLLLFAYLFIPAYTPNFYTLDSNGPKFVAIALLNIISLIVFLTDRDFRKRPELRSGFFLNFIGLAYSLFLMVSLVSFFQAITISESIINFSKLFSVFAASYSLFVIFSINRNFILHAALAMVFVLLFDCMTVFLHIVQYISKNVNSIYDIKSVYSHKNILSASLFIKIPAAIWLMIFFTGWKRNLGAIALFLGALAILFLSSRAFYLGLAVLTAALAIYFLARHFRIAKSISVKNTLIFAGLIVVAFLLFTLIQRNLYPVNSDTKEKFNTGVVERLSTIRADESSTNARLNNWANSWLLIKEHPITGVGTGNWKIQTLKYESPKSDNFISSYKNHNDFIEVTAETGLPGGLIYLSVFLLILISFIRVALNPTADQEKVKLLFLPAFGILAYSVDAFFNFPNDRPEIQALFAIFVGMASAFSGSEFGLKAKLLKPDSAASGKFAKPAGWLFAGIGFTLMTATLIVLYMNALSLHYQRYVFQDEKQNRYSVSSAFLISGFPAIPQLSSDGAPISTYKARYLINENNPGKAIRYLLRDNPSPYDGRREYYLSMAYEKKGRIDSVTYWGMKANQLKPLFGNMAMVLSSRQFVSGKTEAAMKTINDYLSRVKNNPDAWVLAAQQYRKLGKTDKALHVLDSTKIYLPGNKKIQNEWRELRDRDNRVEYNRLFTEATAAIKKKQYSRALDLFNSFLEKKPDLGVGYQNRALCYFYLKNYSGSNTDIDKAISLGEVNEPYLLNLKGVNLLELKRKDEACSCFKAAMEKGNLIAEKNYKKYCK